MSVSSAFIRITRFYRFYVAWLLGAFISFPYLEWLRYDTGLSFGWGLLAIFLYSSVIFGALTYALLFKYSIPILGHISQKWQWCWIIFSFLFGVWLSLAIPVDFPLRAEISELQIVATGNRNSQSNGSEVWVSRLVTREGVEPVDRFSAGEGWEIREGLWFSSYSKGALVWRGTISEKLQLVFVSHPWSGIVEVTWNGQSQFVDLFDPAGGEIILDLIPSPPTQPSLTRRFLFMSGVSLGIGLLILLLGVWLFKRLEAQEIVHKKTSPINFLKYSLTSCIGLCYYWLVYYPGIMGSDVVDQWGQMLSFQINDAHPAAHTLYFWFLTRFWNSPAVVTMFQIVAFSLLVGKIMDFFEQRGAPTRWLWIIAILFGANPLNAVNVISLWKDTLFSIFFLALFYSLLKIVWSNGTWLNSIKNLVLFFLVMLGMILVRHNGILVVIGVVSGLLIFCLRRHRYIIVAGFVAVLVTRSIIIGPFYDLLHVQRVPSERFLNSYVAYHLGYFISEEPDLINNDQKEKLDNLYPIGTQWHFQKYCLNSIGFNLDIINKIDKNTINILMDLSIKNPTKIIKHIFDQGSLIWKIRQLDSYVWLFHEPLHEQYIYPLEWGPKLEQQSFFPYHARLIGDLLSWGRRNDGINWLLFRPALYLYFSTFILILTVIKNQNLSIIVLWFPIATQSVTMLLLIPCQDFRYQYPVYVTSLIILPMIFIKKYTDLIRG